MEKKLSNERVEKIMASLNGMQKAAAPDFFYTRLQGKMQNQQEDKPFFLLRPVFITAALSIFLIVNIFSLLEIKMSTARSAKPATIEAFAKAYDMNTGSVYE
jgi:hypothetical protein